MFKHVNFILIQLLTYGNYQKIIYLILQINSIHSPKTSEIVLLMGFMSSIYFQMSSTSYTERLLLLYYLVMIGL